LDKQYLFSFLNSDSFEQDCIFSAQGIAQKNMSTEWLKEYEIPLPQLENQRKIATVLNKVTSLIDYRSGLCTNTPPPAEDSSQLLLAGFYG
jgi:type I restriction enzyme S subunit